MNIKRIVLTLLTGTMLLIGCNKDLDIVQNNAVTANNMWQTEDDVRSAVYGNYIYLRNSFKTNIIYWGEYRNGLWGPGTHGTLNDPDQSSMISSTMNSTNSYASWTNLYTAINYANLIIKYTEQMEISQNAKDFGLSNAYFIRAYCYFWIGRIWGDAPLALEGFESPAQDMYLPRSPQANVFNQVESDIAKAEEYIQPSETDKAAATRAAVAMLKADFGLWMYGAQHAGDAYLSLAESAISSLSLSPNMLETNYADIFDPAKKEGKEIILAIHQAQGESEDGFIGPQLWNRGYIQAQYVNTTVPALENQWWVYTDSYIDIITGDNTDQRAAVTYGHGPYGTNDVEIGWANKYTGRMVSGTRVLDNDIILYRYAQAYLFDAESKYYRQNYTGALVSLRAIANRAYGNPNYYKDPSAASVRQAIITENLKEFASEGNTWWALVRTDAIWDYNPNLARQKDKKNVLLWPVNQSALNRNRNLTQTEGWQ